MIAGGHNSRSAFLPFPPRKFGESAGFHQREVTFMGLGE
jgi:hypothetical protein